jgi:hypothetical protein
MEACGSTMREQIAEKEMAAARAAADAEDELKRLRGLARESAAEARAKEEKRRAEAIRVKVEQQRSMVLKAKATLTPDMSESELAMNARLVHQGKPRGTCPW